MPIITRELWAGKAEEILDKLAARVVDIQLYLFELDLAGPGVRPQILLSPCLAEGTPKAAIQRIR